MSPVKVILLDLNSFPSILHFVRNSELYKNCIISPHVISLSCLFQIFDLTVQLYLRSLCRTIAEVHHCRKHYKVPQFQLTLE